MTERMRGLATLITDGLLNKQVETTTHMRDCLRCRKVLSLAVEAQLERRDAGGWLGIGIGIPPSAWFFTLDQDLMRELRQCEGWPIGI